ncbi:superoxide dismutase [Erythrobacter sp. BLCC-B19]|uniref:superoxide dismutase n=1 Tax=Erythrobacter sp. BLCC-B19 TaxID=3025315 RepID=UPI00235E3D4C|nr:superoxide dismutase [Erythrobacter sp. BLCC-B19]WDA42070.1 superoxide dismutase [Erythrobacter sp. BLCC-B19]
MTRAKAFSLAIAALALPAAALPLAVSAQQSAPAPAPAVFTLAPLPYAPEALEPVIDAETMRIHHGKHHQAYVDNLNKAIAADPSLAGVPLEQLVARAGTLPAAIRNNAGGHWNHTFFWETMAPADKVGAISPELAAAIDAQFGGMDKFKAAFKAAGTARFGSGWVWLIVGADGKLAITSTPNQDNPLMDAAEVKGTPVLGNDVWEHAYYLKWQNRRGDYLDGWWQVVDWGKVSARYAAATKAG